MSRSATCASRLQDIGYKVPVAFASGLEPQDGSFTVIYNGERYAADPADTPFTTTGTFNAAQWLSLSTPSDLITYNQGGTGATDTTVKAKLQETVSVKDFGAVGDGVTDDTAAIQAALNAGSVYFPATDDYYLISDDLTMSDGTIVSGDGYKSQIRQTAQGKNAFVAGHDCVAHDLRIKMVDGNNLDLTKQNAVYIDGKKNVTVQGNWLELAEIAVSGVQVRGAAANITVKGNIIYGGGWSSGAGPAASAADILFYNSAASTRIIIDGNYCLSNNSQGIFVDALGYNADIAITNNVCVTLDPTTCTQGGTWAEVASGGTRRHGILLGYNNTSVDGPRAVVSGNLCRNTLWTGIYLQGTSAGRICSNNVCSNNGYDIGQSLSGGIYIIQNGHELIEGNLILDFKNTGPQGVGGITINATTTALEPSKISGNLVRGSASAGINLGTNTALCEVSDNLLIENARSDISAVSANAAGNGGHFIARNNIYRTSGTDVTAIQISPATLSSLVTRVIGNKIRGFDNTTNNTTNVGIRCIASVALYDIKDNTIENFYHGLYFANYQATNRDAQIEGNTFVDCSVGISMGATTANVTVPVVDNRFIGMLVSETAAALGGYGAARMCTREGTRLVVHTYNAIPTNGDWQIGDRAMFTTPVAGGNIGAVCVTAGTPGTWKTYGAIAP